jgi:hypothetical protein
VPDEIRQTLATEPHTKIKVMIQLCQPTTDQVQEGWVAFGRLGHGAGPGQFRDAAADHDRWLYGKES